MDEPSRMRQALPKYFDYLVGLLPAVTNVGESGDDQDLYLLTDAAVEATSRSHPPFLCRSRCAHCCHGPLGLPRVTALEWRRLHGAAVQLAPAVQRSIVRQVHEMFDPLFDDLLRQDLGRVDATVQCPFLRFDRCTVYQERPLDCRSFGHFALHQKDGRFAPYMCTLAHEHILDQFPEDTALPMYNPFHERLDQLQEPVVATALPVWIAAHTDAGQFSLRLDLAPDFPAAVARFRAMMGRSRP